MCKLKITRRFPFFKSCKHAFHSDCLREYFNSKNSSLAGGILYQCPVCKIGSNFCAIYSKPELEPPVKEEKEISIMGFLAWTGTEPEKSDSAEELEKAMITSKELIKMKYVSMPSFIEKYNQRRTNTKITKLEETADSLILSIWYILRYSEILDLEYYLEDLAEVYSSVFVMTRYFGIRAPKKNNDTLIELVIGTMIKILEIEDPKRSQTQKLGFLCLASLVEIF